MLIVFGIVFTVIGLLACIICLGLFIVTGELFTILVGGALAIVFSGLGIGLLVSVFRSTSNKRNILKHGDVFFGVICDYSSGTGVSVNGAMPVDLIIKANCNGEELMFTVPTGEYNTAKYPIGARCKIAVLGGEAAFIPNSILLY